jgi:hypothetical protein
MLAGATVPLSAIALAFSLIALPGIAQAQSAPSPSPTSTASQQGGTTTSTGGGGTPPVPRTAPFSRLPVIDITPDLTEPVYIPNGEGLPGQQSIKETAPTLHYVPNTANSAGALYQYQQFDVGGLVRLPVFRWMSLGYDRQIGGTIDQPAVGNGGQTVKNTPAGPVLVPPATVANQYGSGNARDITQLYHVIFTVGKGLALDVGDAFRHRAYADDGSGVSGTPLYLTKGAFDVPYGTVASVEAHYAFATLTYVTPPIRQLHGLTLAFSEQGSAQNVDHHVGDALICTAVNTPIINSYPYATNNNPELVCPGVGKEAYIDENPSKNRYYTSTETVTANLPLDRHRNGSNFIVTETTGALNWYENYPIPFKWASQTTATLSKRFNSVFSVAIRYRQQVEDINGEFFIPTGSAVDHNAVSIIGTPYAYPSQQRVGSIDVIGTFHVDAGTLFH